MPMTAVDTSMSRRFRDLVQQSQAGTYTSSDGQNVIQLPGVYDCMSAITCEKLGFDAVFTSGLSISASALGMPDLGLMTATENIGVVQRIVDSVNIPVIADMDTYVLYSVYLHLFRGYGAGINVERVVRDCIRVGIAGITLEDQEWPKKCGHFENKSVIAAEAFEEKVKSAAWARSNTQGDIYHCPYRR